MGRDESLCLLGIKGVYMDVYQILIKHNRAWSEREIIAFSLVMMVILMVLAWLLHKRKIAISQAVAVVAFAGFLGIVLASTVFTREVEVRQYKLIPFWSWGEVIVHHDMELLQEILLNCILLLPAGCLLPFMRGRMVRPCTAFVIGFGISAVIEVSQLVFRRGLFEWDDMIHNALGCVIGCVVVNVWMRWNKFAKKRQIL